MGCKSLGTPAQEAELKKAMESLRGKEGSTMPALQKAQEIYGYLPLSVQEYVADVLDVPLEEVYGVATFYSQFTLEPKGKYTVGICLGTACYVKGSGVLLEKMEQLLEIKAGKTTKDGKFTLDATRCIGCCGLAPVLTVNEDVYGKATPEKLNEILEMYK